MTKVFFICWITIFFSFFISNDQNNSQFSSPEQIIDIPIASSSSDINPNSANIDFLKDKFLLFTIVNQKPVDDFEQLKQSGVSIGFLNNYTELNEFFVKNYQKFVFFRNFIDIDNINNESKNTFNFQNALKLRKNESVRFHCDYQLFSSNNNETNINYGIQLFTDDLMFFNNFATVKIFFIGKNYMPWPLQLSSQIISEISIAVFTKLFINPFNNNLFQNNSHQFNENIIIKTDQVVKYQFNSDLINSLSREEKQYLLNNLGFMIQCDSFRNYSLINNCSILINWNEYYNNHFLTFTGHLQYNNFPYILNVFGKKKYPLIEISLSFLYISETIKTFFAQDIKPWINYNQTINKNMNLSSLYCFLGFQKNIYFHYSILENFINNVFIYYIFSWDNIVNIFKNNILMNLVDNFIWGFSLGIKSLHICFVLYNGHITIFSRLKMGLLKMHINEIQNIFLDHKLKVSSLKTKNMQDFASKRLI